MCTTTFIDDSPELFEFNPAQDLTTRLLTYLSDLVVNGSILKDERLWPDPSVQPIIPDVEPKVLVDGGSGTASPGRKGKIPPPPDGWRQVLQAKV